MSLDDVMDVCSPCSCKDFLDAARRPSLAEPAWAVWNVSDDRVTSVCSLAERSCTCGSGQKPCAALAHLQVLDACSAACYELRDYEQALGFGTMMINIAPGRPNVRPPSFPIHPFFFIYIMSLDWFWSRPNCGPLL